MGYILAFLMLFCSTSQAAEVITTLVDERRAVAKAVIEKVDQDITNYQDAIIKLQAIKAAAENDLAVIKKMTKVRIDYSDSASETVNIVEPVVIEKPVVEPVAEGNEGYVVGGP